MKTLWHHVKTLEVSATNRLRDIEERISGLTFKLSSALGKPTHCTRNLTAQYHTGTNKKLMME